ncbi:hypothetical protein KCP73_19185 [Salmonella enterica subsp. enterica]|nr:hypothetical protein KCP73_19185 [Salmonella enterica subsp. enterica]
MDAGRRPEVKTADRRAARLEERSLTGGLPPLVGRRPRCRRSGDRLRVRGLSRFTVPPLLASVRVPAAQSPCAHRHC